MSLEEWSSARQAYFPWHTPRENRGWLSDNCEDHSTIRRIFRWKRFAPRRVPYCWHADASGWLPLHSALATLYREWPQSRRTIPARWMFSMARSAWSYVLQSPMTILPSAWIDYHPATTRNEFHRRRWEHCSWCKSPPSAINRCAKKWSPADYAGCTTRTFPPS